MEASLHHRNAKAASAVVTVGKPWRHRHSVCWLLLLAPRWPRSSGSFLQPKAKTQNSKLPSRSPIVRCVLCCATVYSFIPSQDPPSIIRHPSSVIRHARLTSRISASVLRLNLQYLIPARVKIVASCTNDVGLGVWIRGGHRRVRANRSL